MDGEAFDPVEQQGGNKEQAFGVYHTPKDFVRLAETLNHPFDDSFAIEDLTRQNIFELLTKGISHVANKRLGFARRIATLANELKHDEKRFQASLPPHAQEVLKGKRVLLFRYLLKEVGCPDMEVADLMLGLDLVGVASKSPFFDTKITPATATPQFALISARWQRKRIEANDIHKDDPELSKILWETTQSEVEAGFLQGPFQQVHQVREALGQADFVCSRRFAIMQGGKPRIIDDLKESGVNKAFAAVEKLTLHDIDYISSLLHFIASTVSKAQASEEQIVQVVLKEGAVLSGPLHRDFKESMKWKGRCLDLTKAYKQIPVSAASRPFCVLMVHHFESGKPVYFVSRSLPFGASSSVFGFNRISRGLWQIATVGCKINGGVFFDDFPFFEPATACSLASKAFEGLLKALGWKFSEDPKKALPFAEEVDVLGVRLSVGNLHQGAFAVENKPGRIEKISALIQEVATEGRISKRQAQVIHGNLNFAMSFVLGHTMKVAARAFACLTIDRSSPDTNQLVPLCEWTLDLLKVLKPRVTESSGSVRPVLIFTDAAYEGGLATCGLVVLSLPPWLIFGMI